VAVTRLTAAPGTRLPVANGPAARVFAVESGTLTAEVGARPGGSVAVTRGSAAPTAAAPGASVAVAAGDLLATAPGADYALANAGPAPAVALVVVVANVLSAGSPAGNAAAAASWAVAAMPEAVGGALPSPAGFGGRVVAADVEVAVPPGAFLGVGRADLAPGAVLALPPGEGALLAAVEAGRIAPPTAGGATAGALAAGAWTQFPVGGGGSWRAGDDAPAALLVLAVGRDDTAAPGAGTPAAETAAHAGVLLARSS
jgi:mannose-6-phosphate isomerase-like protein (cupin superfamily)